MSHTVFRLDELEWTDRGDGRQIARLSDALTHSRANLWRLPSGAKGRRHVENVQEEVFVVLDGRLTLLLGDPPDRVEVERGSVAVVPTGTPLQLRNEGDGEVLLFAYGAPPETGKAEYLPDAE